MQFSNRILNCDLLGIREDLDFYHLLSAKLSKAIQSFAILFVASKNDYSATKFHNMCNGQANTITIIKSHSNHIFGGYKASRWHPLQYNHHPNSFLFLIRGKETSSSENKYPQAIHTQPPIDHYFDSSVHYDTNRGPQFGTWGAFDISIKDRCDSPLPDKSSLNFTEHNYTRLLNYWDSSGNGHDCDLSGGEHDSLGRHSFFQVIDYVVIKIIHT